MDHFEEKGHKPKISMDIRKNKKENWFEQKSEICRPLEQKKKQEHFPLIKRPVRLGACVGGLDMYWEWLECVWPSGQIKDGYGNIHEIKEKIKHENTNPVEHPLSLSFCTVIMTCLHMCALTGKG